MKANRSGARVERAGVGANHALAQIRALQPLVAQIALYKLRHRPIEEQSARLIVRADTLLNLRARRRFADPEVTFARRSQCIAQSRNHVIHRAPAIHIAGRKLAHLGCAQFVIVPKLNAGAVEKRNEQSVDSGEPFEPPPRQLQLLNYKRMQ